MKSVSAVIIYRLVFNCRFTLRAKKANEDHLSFDKEVPDMKTTPFSMQNPSQLQQKLFSGRSFTPFFVAMQASSS